MTQKILAVTLEPISETMAGPAIRCLELSRQLARYFDVVVSHGTPKFDMVQRSSTGEPDDVAGSNGTGSNAGACRFRYLKNPSHRQLYQQARNADILFIQGNVLKEYPGLSRLNKYLVVDLYDPYLLSLLPQYVNHPVTADSSYRLMHHVLGEHLAVTDFSICASQRQRDYWIGRYCSLGRINPELYQLDPTLHKLAQVVPFGVPDYDPQSVMLHGASIRGAIAGIETEDQVLYWGGGIWEWFDPLSIIKAVVKLKDRFPRLRLLFAGWKSPNPSVPSMSMSKQAYDLADELGVLNKHVYFYEQWIPYQRRAGFLLDCDIAVSAHFESVETRFAYRTRILDYLWAGRPVITTCGDELSEIIAKHQCGKVVGYQDIDGWVCAIEELLSNPAGLRQAGQNSRSVSREYTWDKVSLPLIEYCRNPYHLPDFRAVRKPTLITRARAVYERGGVDLVIKRSAHLINDIMAR